MKHEKNAIRRELKTMKKIGIQSNGPQLMRRVREIKKIKNSGFFLFFLLFIIYFRSRVVPTNLVIGVCAMCTENFLQFFWNFFFGVVAFIWPSSCRVKILFHREYVCTTADFCSHSDFVDSIRLSKMLLIPNVHGTHWHFSRFRSHHWVNKMWARTNGTSCAHSVGQYNSSRSHEKKKHQRRCGFVFMAYIQNSFLVSGPILLSTKSSKTTLTHTHTRTHIHRDLLLPKIQWTAYRFYLFIEFYWHPLKIRQV